MASANVHTDRVPGHSGHIIIIVLNDNNIASSLDTLPIPSIPHPQHYELLPTALAIQMALEWPQLVSIEYLKVQRAAVGP